MADDNFNKYDPEPNRFNPRDFVQVKKYPTMISETDIQEREAAAESRGYTRGVEDSAKEVDTVLTMTMVQPARNDGEVKTKMELSALLGALAISIRALTKGT